METVNPTADNSGASIQDRLETLLSADEPQAQNEADAPEVEAQAEPADIEVEVDADEGEGAGDEPSISLSDLSKYLGIDEQHLDVDEDGTVSIKTKVDGQEGKTKLKDLQTSYQLRQHLDNETRAVAEQHKAIQAHAQQVEQAIQERVQQVEGLANAAQEQLTREFNGIDWQMLRQTDPGEYSALYQDFQNRQAHINSIAQQAQQQRQQHEAQQLQQRDAMISDLYQRSVNVISESVPEWSDPEVKGKEISEIGQTLRSEVTKFFGDKEADRIMNEINSGYYGPLPIILARKAMLYDRMQGSRAAVENKVRTAPKLVKPGQAVPSNSNESSLRNLKAKVQKSGGKQGIAEYLLASGKV